MSASFAGFCLWFDCV